MPFSLPQLADAADLRGKRVLLRLNLDLPVTASTLRDTHRLERSRQTLEFLRAQGAKTCIISHIGRDPDDTLRPVYECLKALIPLRFVASLAEAKEEMSRLREGEFLLLENLRSFQGETTNDALFAKELAVLGDVFVNEAFAASHRAHSSIVGVPRLLPSYAGIVFAEEVERLSQAFSPTRPALVILGGAKFETKMPLIAKFLKIADYVFVCGALSNGIYKARGYETGASLVSPHLPPASLRADPKLQVPVDVVVSGASGDRQTAADTVLPTEKIVDAGSETLADLRALIEKAKFVLWNGPLGEYEAGFDAGTIALAEMLAESDAETIVGGGDSLAVVSKLGLLERFSFVSTGGGAMLEFLATGTLPGIEALSNKYN